MLWIDTNAFQKKRTSFINHPPHPKSKLSSNFVTTGIQSPPGNVHMLTATTKSITKEFPLGLGLIWDHFSSPVAHIQILCRG